MHYNKFRVKAFGILEVNMATLIFMTILLISLNIVVSVSAKAPSKREFLRVDRYRDSLVRVFTKHGYAGEVELSESWGKIIVENIADKHQSPQIIIITVNMKAGYRRALYYMIPKKDSLFIFDKYNQ